MERFALTNPMKYHVPQLKAVRPAMSFDPAADFDVQKKALRARLEELLCVPERTGACVPLIEYEDRSDPRFDEIRFLTETEKGFFVPSHLLLPKNRAGKIPLVICLQGHTSGMHVSLGREMHPSKKPIKTVKDRDFALQAVARGYAALAMEQRGFGELNFDPDRPYSCHMLTWQAAMMGRTLLGERICDIMALIDAVGRGFEGIDMDRIGIMGNSGGGTSSYFAACIDERIKVSMPASSFCSFVDSWGSIYHCDCAYVHGLLNDMEMSDMAAMIAPRALIAVNGVHDHLQPFESAKAAFEKVKEIYRAAGAENNCDLVAGPEGHRFYAELAWPVFARYI